MNHGKRAWTERNCEMERIRRFEEVLARLIAVRWRQVHAKPRSTRQNKGDWTMIHK